MAFFKHPANEHDYLHSLHSLVPRPGNTGLMGDPKTRTNPCKAHNVAALDRMRYKRALGRAL